MISEYNREVLSWFCGNRLAVYNDNGDAWDFPIYYDQISCGYFAAVGKFHVDGPSVAKQVYRYGSSTVEQEVILTCGS